MVAGEIRAAREMANPSGLHPEESAFKSPAAYLIPDWTDELNRRWFPEKTRNKQTCSVKTCAECKTGFETKSCKQRFCSRKCYDTHRISTSKPSYEVLSEDLKYDSFVAVGKKYGVSDNAIRKWLKKYESMS